MTDNEKPVIGDAIVYKKNLYYIYDRKEEMFMCFPMDIENCGIEVYVDDQRYYLSLSQTRLIPRHMRHFVMGVLDDSSQSKRKSALKNKTRIYQPRPKKTQNALFGNPKFIYPVGQIMMGEETESMCICFQSIVSTRVCC